MDPGNVQICHDAGYATPMSKDAKKKPVSKILGKLRFLRNYARDHR